MGMLKRDEHANLFIPFLKCFQFYRDQSVFVLVGLFLVTGMGVLVCAVISFLMGVVVYGASRSVTVIVLMLVGMGMNMLVSVGMAVGSPLVGVGVIVIMAVLVIMIMCMLMFSFH
jgi:hypothetical protein